MRILLRTILTPSLIGIALSSAFSATDDTDSVQVKNFYLDEVVIVSNPKENTQLFRFPGSITAFSENRLEQMNVTSLKDLSSLVPNLFIPDYGSKLISSIYIRGIGSRINSPAVGLNVDNVPYLDKSAFDFDFMDIERIEVLRGPQGTLYGRNTMAGLINVYTKSPFNHQGTKIRAGYGNYEAWNAAVSHASRINRHFAFSLNGRYRKDDGYFDNVTTGKRCGASEVAGGRLQLNWRPGRQLKIDFASDFEYSNQDGYPYSLYDDKENPDHRIDYNDPASYKRNLSSNSIFLQYIHDKFILSSSTGYQYMDDEMNLDQDFTPASVFTLCQKQHEHIFSQELTLKSNTGWNYQWLTGAFGFYQHLNTTGPVTFKEDGMDYIGNMITRQIDAVVPPVMQGRFKVKTDPSMYIDGRFKTPAYGLALFHQSTYNNLFIENLSLSAGLRLDYERTNIDYFSGVEDGVNIDYVSPMPIDLKSLDQLKRNGKDHVSSWQLLPRISLKYIFENEINVYANISKGYRSGGFNIQMFSDIIRDDMIADFIRANLEDPRLGSMLNGKIPESLSVKKNDIHDLITYKPESSWNYEAGIHTSFLNHKLTADLAFFYIDCRNQQISEFAAGGFGRITKNTGRTTSKGTELSFRFIPVRNYHIGISYGYTHAIFKEYLVGNTDFSGKYVPFAPKHTLSATTGYRIEFRHPVVRFLDFGLQFMGRGKIYWTENNEVSQPFYGLLNGEITLGLCNHVDISLWGKNLTQTRYQAFYFESMGNGFMQEGRPLTFGGNVTLRF